MDVPSISNSLSSVKLLIVLSSLLLSFEQPRFKDFILAPLMIWSLIILDKASSLRKMHSSRF